MSGQKMFMIVDIDRCWGCKACQVACKREHGLASEDFKPVEVFRVENMQGDRVRCDFLPIACQHCTSPACAEVCPRGALVRTDEGLIAVVEDRCIGCGLCFRKCPYGAIGLKIVDGKVELDAEKCNHCGRCVKSCPVDAWEGTPGYIVSFGGTFGNNIYKGEELLPLIPDKETLFRVTDAAITFFEKNANPSERFRKTLQRVGEEDFRKQLKEAYEGQ